MTWVVAGLSIAAVLAFIHLCEAQNSPPPKPRLPPEQGLKALDRQLAATWTVVQRKSEKVASDLSREIKKEVEASRRRHP